MTGPFRIALVILTVKVKPRRAVNSVALDASPPVTADSAPSSEGQNVMDLVVGQVGTRQVCRHHQLLSSSPGCKIHAGDYRTASACVYGGKAARSSSPGRNNSTAAADLSPGTRYARTARRKSTLGRACTPAGARQTSCA